MTEKLTETQANMLFLLLSDHVDNAENGHQLRNAQETVENLSPLLPPEQRTHIRQRVRDAIAEARSSRDE